MKSKFKFDKASGTYIPSEPAIEQGLKANVKDEVIKEVSTPTTTRPHFQKEKKLDVQTTRPNVPDSRVIQMKRVDSPTPVQLVDSNGLPEAYLDSVNTGVFLFRDKQDFDICQITDERSGKVLAYIGGYALQFSFNMDELRTMERIEECLQGLVKLFRHKIMTQALGRDPAV